MGNDQPALRIQQLASIDYAGVATVNMIYRRKDVPKLPQGAGFVVPAIDHRYLLACTFANQKYGGRCPDDMVLLRAFVGGALHQDDLAHDDSMMVSKVHEELVWRFGISSEPVHHLVVVGHQPMAQHSIGHEARRDQIRQLEREAAGLGLIGNGYEGVGMPDIISQANQTVDRLISI